MGDDTLTRLELTFDELVTAYPVAPPAELLSLLAATTHIDLKQQHATTARLRTAASLARDAEHAEIRAWCYETEAWGVLTDDGARRQAEHARRW